MGILPKLAGHMTHQGCFHRVDILALGNASAVADAKNMRIHRDGGPAERGVEHHIGGLAANAGQALQGGTVFRYFAAMLVEQNAAGLDGVFGLGVKQANRLDVLL